MDIMLKEHNRKSVENTINLFKTNDRVCIEQATATGKSYVMAGIISSNLFQRVLVLAPSNYILNQFQENFPELVKKVKILDFATYSKTLFFDENLVVDGDYDLIILDEYHRLGAKQWGESVKQILNKCPNTKVFGATATPKRFLDNGRCMSQELFNNVVANRITLRDAFENDILTKPKYVIGMYDIKDDITRLECNLKSVDMSIRSKIETEIKYVKSNFEKLHGIENIFNKHITNERKFIVFCENVEHLNEMILIVPEWFNRVFKSKPSVFSIYSQNKLNDLKLEMFKHSNRDDFSLLFVVNMLNEGVHIDDVDGLIMLRYTNSLNIYLQQLGRGLFANYDKQPLIIDLVKNSENIVQKQIYLNENNIDVKSLSNTLSNECKRYEYVLKQYFDIHDESLQILDIITAIDENMSDWNNQYNQLIEFKNIYGNTLIPKTHTKLYRFRMRQCYLKSSGRLSEDRIKKLDSIGFVWNYKEYLWEMRLNELIDFKEKFGHTIVPRSGEYKVLGTWLTTQKRKYSKGELLQYRRTLLIGVGVDFDKKRADIEEDKFMAKVSMLQEYLNIYGNCNVSSRNREWKELSNWVGHTRKMFKKGKLPEHRYKILEDMGFVFNAKSKEIDDE